MMSVLRSEHVEEFNFMQFMWTNKKFVYQVGNNKKVTSARSAQNTWRLFYTGILVSVDVAAERVALVLSPEVSSSNLARGRVRSVAGIPMSPIQVLVSNFKLSHERFCLDNFHYITQLSSSYSELFGLNYWAWFQASTAV
jgi:hypothetical protein